MCYQSSGVAIEYSISQPDKSLQSLLLEQSFKHSALNIEIRLGRGYMLVHDITFAVAKLKF